MSDKKIEIRWDVKNMNLLWTENISLISPRFPEEEIAHPHRLRLVLTRIVKPVNKEESIESEKATEVEYISLYIQNLFFENCSAFCPILNVSFLLSHPLHGEILRQSKIQFDACYKNLFGFEKFISMEKLKEYCLDEFTIICKFQKLTQDFKRHAQFFNQHNTSDISLIVGVDKIQTFPAHKLVLALSSKIFRGIFAQEQAVSFFKMENTRPEVAIELLRYMYTGEAIYTESLAYELFEVALDYRTIGLAVKCQVFLMQNLKLRNVVRTLLSCRDVRIWFYTVGYLRELILKCMSLISEHVDDVLRFDLCKELLEKAPEILTEVVAHLCTTNVAKTDSSEEESTAFSQNFKKLFEAFEKSSDYSDIEIHVKDSNYPAHKLILAARSPVFGRMFSHNMKETISGVVTIEDIRPEVFEMVLKFIYTDEIESDDLLQELLIASDKYEISDLKWKCENILEEKLTPDNVITMMIFAADHNAERLKKKCFGYITRQDSPFWSDEENHFAIPKSKLNRYLAKSHPYLLNEILKEILQNYMS